MFLSIIIPVYNLEKYIAECLDSILDQNIASTNYEILCVDDGSSDNSADIIRSYAEQYDHIQLLSKENGGVGSARNFGLNHAIGEYVWFIDGDDYIDVNCLDFIEQSLGNNQADIFELNVQMNTPLEKNKIFALDDTVTEYDTGVVFTYIVRRSVLEENHIRFHEKISHGEDWLFRFYTSLISVKRISSKHVCYHYRVRANSASTDVSKASVIKKLNSVLVLSEVYQAELRQTDDEARIQRIQNRLDVSTVTAITQILKFLPKEERSVWLKQLKAAGLYPYQHRYSLLKPKKNMKDTLLQWMKFSYSNELCLKLWMKLL